MKYLKTFLPSLGAGALLAFAYPNFLGNGFFPFALVAFAIYYDKLIQTPSLLKMFLHTAIFCLIFSAVGFYWIPQTLSTFGGISIFQGYVTSIFFSLIVLPHLWLQTLLAFFLKKYKSTQVTYLIFLSITHVLSEQIISGQFPVWLGHSLLTTNGSLVLTSVFGAGIYSLSLVLLSMSVQPLLHKKAVLKLPFFLGASILFAEFVLSFFIHYPSAIKDVSQTKLNVRFVQANIGNFLKLESEKGHHNSTAEVYGRYERQSFAKTNAPTPDAIDLLIWPETAVPTLFNSDYWDNSKFVPYEYMNAITKELSPNTSFVFGGYDEGGIKNSANEEKSEFNTAFFYQNNKLSPYHKIKLIPFGETLPFGQWNTALSPYFAGVSLFSQGPRFVVFSLFDQYEFITPICYEILDTRFMRSFANASNSLRFIVNLTNDSWYGDTAEPWQHLYLARWRALELRRPILRSTNTGITTVIDENARFENYLSIHEESFLDAKIYLHNTSKTLYQRFGLLPLLLLLASVSLLGFFLRSIKTTR